MANTPSVKRTVASAVKGAKDDLEAGANDVAAEAKAGARKTAREVGELEASLTRSAEDLSAAVAGTLRSAGVDTDHLVDVAKEQASDLQRLIIQEIQERPLRALGLAAAVGLFVGFLSAR